MTGISPSERDHMQYVFIIFGFFGLISSSVVLTPILFKKFRQYFFLRILSIISFCDTFTTISYLLNINRNVLQNNRLCQFQGVLNTLSINSSVSWTVALSLQLYSIVKYKEPYFSERILYLVFWGIPILVAVIPVCYSETSYGMDDKIPEMAIGSCNIRTGYPGSDTGHVIFNIVIYAFKIVSFAVLTILYVLTRQEIGTIDQSNHLLKITSIMGLYPLTLGVLWLPAVVSQILLYFYNEINNIAFMICLSISSLYGFTVAIIFFYGNKQARSCWYTLLTEFKIVDSTASNLNNLRVRFTGHSYSINDANSSNFFRSNTVQTTTSSIDNSGGSLFLVDAGVYDIVMRDDSIESFESTSSSNTSPHELDKSYAENKTTNLLDADYFTINAFTTNTPFTATTTNRISANRHSKSTTSSSHFDDI
jgi:hypothetical protein